MTPPSPARALIFDSGVGGLSVLDAIVAARLDLDVDYLADAAWLPYGDKSPDALRHRAPALIRAAARAFQSTCVVVACNTASTHAIEAIRAAVAVPVVGVVPPVKPAAAMTQTGAIGVLATAATVRSPYLDDLIARFAVNVGVQRCAAPDLVALAEQKLAGEAIAEAAVAEAVAPMFAGDLGARLDVVALACTHFPLLHEELARAAPRPVQFLDSGAAIARRLAQVSGVVTGRTRLRGAVSTAVSLPLTCAARVRGFELCGGVFTSP